MTAQTAAREREKAICRRSLSGSVAVANDVFFLITCAVHGDPMYSGYSSAVYYSSVVLYVCKDAGRFILTV